MPLVFMFISDKHAVYKTYSITKKIIKWGLISVLGFFILFNIFLGGNPNSDFYIGSSKGEWWFEDVFMIVLLLICGFCMFCLLFFYRE